VGEKKKKIREKEAGQSTLEISELKKKKEKEKKKGREEEKGEVFGETFSAGHFRKLKQIIGGG